MAEKHSFGVKPVTCHAVSGDKTGLALSLNDHEVKIFKKNGMKWQETHTLEEHGQRVTGIDWAPRSNRIVTCGAVSSALDRNAYVWTYQDGKWKPHLVILRINRAATCVRWSPEENKFAVGSSARLISVSYYEDEHTWWVSKHIKKPIRSTVTCLDWHPNNILIAAGSTDFKARVFSGYIKEVESKPGPNSWGSKMPFASLMAEFSNGGGGWVHAVSFSPSGEKIAWVGHDSSVSVGDSTQENRLIVIKDTFLPFMGITWVTENSMVAAGYDCNPMLLTYNSGQGTLSVVSKLDIPQEKTAGTIRQVSVEGAAQPENGCDGEQQQQEEGEDEEQDEMEVIMNAMNRFKDLDKKASSGDVSTELKTQHQNTITQVSVFEGTKDQCRRISTSGVDGNMIIWDLNSLERSIQALRIS